MSTKIPKDWLGCPPTTSQLIGDLFIVFKVPLGAWYNSKIPPTEWFTPAICLQRNAHHNIGLWIDLTNTNRYYDPAYITGNRIQYFKMGIVGGPQRNPEFLNLDKFISTVNEFIQKNPGKKVAVHCTHGFNRTGYFICAYLAQTNRCNIVSAISEFAQKRPPGIYRQEYIDFLLRKYARFETKIKAPDNPNWSGRVTACPRPPPLPQSMLSFNSVLKADNFLWERDNEDENKRRTCGPE